jgi:copper homeostasis protein
MAPKVEICVESIDDLLVAQQAGADCAELCTGLREGGLTPSLGVVRTALAVATLPFHVMIRPRRADFLYSELEFRSMLEDVMAMKDLGVAGIVTGCLTADGTIDEARMTALVSAAGPMTVTCHRAFDMTRDVTEAIEALIRCGVDRVLTTGQCNSAMEGLATLVKTVAAARGRIRIMACGDLDASNIAEVYLRSRVDELHLAAPRQMPSGMRYRNTGVMMGQEAAEAEFVITVTDEATVKATIAALRAVL